MKMHKSLGSLLAGFLIAVTFPELVYQVLVAIKGRRFTRSLIM